MVGERGEKHWPSWSPGGGVGLEWKFYFRGQARHLHFLEYAQRAFLLIFTTVEV